MWVDRARRDPHPAPPNERGRRRITFRPHHRGVDSRCEEVAFEKGWCPALLGQNRSGRRGRGGGSRMGAIRIDGRYLDHSRYSYRYR
eukprot:10608577-Lingulodinium_polyedra.AAC.1